MGLLNKLFGSADSAVMSSSLVGRGEVLGVEASGTTMKLNNGLTERKCTIKLYVMLDGQRAYETTAVQRVQEVVMPKLASGSAVVAVRVDPNDHSKVAIDFSIPPPTVRLPRNETHTGAAWILANGKPITVVLVANVPMHGVQSADGIDAQLLTLTLVDGVPTPYQIKVANAVPATALPLVYPGSKLHAVLGEGPDHVVVDWSKGAVKAG